MFVAIVVSLLIGAFATSTAEYVKNYNLVDLIIEKVKSLLGKTEAKVKADVNVVDMAVIGRLKKI